LPDEARGIFFTKGLDTDMNGPKTDLPVGLDLALAAAVEQRARMQVRRLWQQMAAA
jgi:hypothetical protein